MEQSPNPEAPNWLAALEARVGQAVGEIDRLRQENRRLEKELSRLRRAKTPEGAAAWEKERDEVRGRVERLARHLEELLGETPAELVGVASAASTAAAEPAGDTTTEGAEPADVPPADA